MSRPTALTSLMPLALPAAAARRRALQVITKRVSRQRLRPHFGIPGVLTSFTARTSVAACRTTARDQFLLVALVAAVVALPHAQHALPSLLVAATRKTIRTRKREAATTSATRPKRSSRRPKLPSA